MHATGRDKCSNLSSVGLGVYVFLGTCGRTHDALDYLLLDCETVLSPLRSLPTELLSLIFDFSLAEPCDILEADPPLWTLSQVCQRWRTILLSQPIIWAKVYLDFSLRPDETRFRLRTQLERSGGLPLDVEFLCDDYRNFTRPERRLCHILMWECQRWERISLYGATALFNDLHLVRGRLPLVNKAQTRRSPEEQAFVNVGHFVPQLTVRLPFPQLLRFGGSNHLGGHLHTLASAHNLVDCALDIYESPLHVSSESRIVLPKLLRLAVSTAAFLGCIETPALQELHCSGPGDCLLVFLPRLKTKLQKLFLHGCNDARFSTLHMSSILFAARTVSELGVHITAAADALLSGLTILEESGDIGDVLPLQTITLDLRTYDTFHDTGRFVDMLESHWRRGKGRLHTACVCTSPSFVEPDSLERIERLREQGLKIPLYVNTQGLVEKTPPHLRVSYRHG
ncbi:hypothetical protein GGX14DRAFT_565663 [Mycena pura]|uniref:F-box domain-containing protein n=1 Tax=Mycena pura TaxID=153505 RepID=A0AAD6VE84_9AGAR|nr:hypothetical protein GGX14DRAFT_565663 [Mycena pura]